MSKESKLIKKLIKGVFRWIVNERRHLIYAASALPFAETPKGYTLIYLSSVVGEHSTFLASNAMLEAGEVDCVKERLENGDAFFGWQNNCTKKIDCFGWVTWHERKIGKRKVKGRPGRVFLYNFYTVPYARGRGLYTALLKRICWGKGWMANKFIIGVLGTNEASIRGIKKAGFFYYGTARVRKWFGRWEQEMEFSLNFEE